MVQTRRTLVDTTPSITPERESPPKSSRTSKRKRAIQATPVQPLTTQDPPALQEHPMQQQASRTITHPQITEAPHNPEKQGLSDHPALLSNESQMTKENQEHPLITGGTGTTGISLPHLKESPSQQLTPQPSRVAKSPSARREPRARSRAKPEHRDPLSRRTGQAPTKSSRTTTRSSPKHRTTPRSQGSDRHPRPEQPKRQPSSSTHRQQKEQPSGIQPREAQQRKGTTPDRQPAPEHRRRSPEQARHQTRRETGSQVLGERRTHQSSGDHRRSNEQPASHRSGDHRRSDLERPARPGSGDHRRPTFEQSGGDYRRPPFDEGDCRRSPGPRHHVYGYHEARHPGEYSRPLGTGLF